MAPLRTVGRRNTEATSDPIAQAAILQHTMIQLRGCGLVPKGVYRFRTHEEADEWMMRQIAATHARRSSKGE